MNIETNYSKIAQAIAGRDWQFEEFLIKEIEKRVRATEEKGIKEPKLLEFIQNHLTLYGRSMYEYSKQVKTIDFEANQGMMN